jgi:nucleoside-diphosphate-sugar epimerase
MNVFVAGATGVVGLPLLRLLRDAGHTVTGMTRSKDKAGTIAALGARAAVVDVYDLAALKAAVAAARPDAVIHQLTDLPDSIDPQTYPAAIARNARVRIEGTPNLVAATVAAGAKRLVAQSVAFAYAPGQGPRRESDALDLGNEARRSLVDGVVALERAVTKAPGIDGVVLRYGYFHGAGTWNAAPQPPAIHVDAAAQAALLALTRGAPGVYNIAADDGVVSSDKARQELGFDPNFRLQ